MTTGDYSKFGTFKKPIFCPRTAGLGYGKITVSVGDFLLYAETRLTPGVVDSCGKPATHEVSRFARVLGKVVRFPNGEEAPKGRNKVVLAVLALSDSMEHAYVRHVPVADVKEIMGRPPGDFIRFFLFGDVPTPEIARDVQDYGAMNESYIESVTVGVGQDPGGGSGMLLKIPDYWRDLAFGRKVG